MSLWIDKSKQGPAGIWVSWKFKSNEVEPFGSR